MRVGKSLALLGLLQVAIAAPAPAPQDEPVASPTLSIPTEVPTNPSVALDQLEALASATAELIQADIEGAGNETSTAARRGLSLSGSCTLSKLKIRREWSVFSSQLHVSCLACPLTPF